MFNILKFLGAVYLFTGVFLTIICLLLVYIYRMKYIQCRFIAIEFAKRPLWEKILVILTCIVLYPYMIIKDVINANVKK